MSKGSKPRPMSVPQEEFDTKWNAIFGKKKSNYTTDYQDILSTEDCVLDALMKLDKDNDTDNKNNNGTVSVPTSR